HIELLKRIATLHPNTQSELAQRVTVTQGVISRMLSRLKKDCYIERKQEWKTKWISLTEKGRCKIDDVFIHQLKFQSSLFDDCLTKSEQKDLYKLMSKLQKHTENQLENEEA